MSTCSELIDTAYKDGMFLNQIITGVLSVWSATEATVGHLEIFIIAKKEETATGQVERQGNAWTLLDSSVMVHMKFIPEGATVNKYCYKQILRRHCSSVCRKNPELWWRKNRLSLQDNLPANCSVLISDHRSAVPPYLPDLKPHNLFLFLHLKEKLCGCQFQSAEEIVTAIVEAIRYLAANVFQQCFQQLHQYLEICIVANSNIFVGECGNV